MNSFILSNLRELSTDEQRQLNGGTTPVLCDADCGTCSCYCKCNSQNPSKSIGNESSDLGADSTTARKVREAMVR